MPLISTSIKFPNANAFQKSILDSCYLKGSYYIFGDRRQGKTTLAAMLAIKLSLDFGKSCIVVCRSKLRQEQFIKSFYHNFNPSLLACFDTGTFVPKGKKYDVVILDGVDSDSYQEGPSIDYKLLDVYSEYVFRIHEIDSNSQNER